MTVGGWIEADRRLRAYEMATRRERKRLDDEAVWNQWESMVAQQERKKQRENAESS